MAATQASEAFLAYESEWSQIKASVQSRFDKDCREQKGEQKKATLRRITMELEEADEIVDQMEMEAKGKAKLMVLVRKYKGEVKVWKTQVKTLSATSDRDTLLSLPAHSAYAIDADDDDTFSPSQAQRTRLLSATQTLKTSDARLDNAQRLALESEEIGGTVLGRLQGQRARMEDTRDMLGEAEGNIGRASGALKGMVRRMYQQRVITVGIIIVLVALILLVLWNKFR